MTHVNQAPVVRTNKPTIAGWLDIAAGIIWLLFDAFLTLFVIGLVVGFGGSVGAIHAHAWVALAAFALPGILAIVGGVFSLRRRIWILALIGSVCAMPFALGIISVVLLIQSRNEFTRP
jgi:hypothetical protein